MMRLLPVQPKASLWAKIRWMLAPSTRTVKTRISVGSTAFEMSPIYILKRMWWAYADPKYNVAFIIPAQNLTSAFNHISPSMDEVYRIYRSNLESILQNAGERGEDWDVINFGDDCFVAIVTKNDDFLAVARLTGTSIDTIRIIFNNFIDYRPGSDVKHRKVAFN